MAKRPDIIVMHHPKLDNREIDHVIDEKQARSLEKAGWKRGPAPSKKAAS